ncbi:MAG: hypothetical protein E7255_13415 [Lachnospiraceae bacterium]|nr:hypothetical protein [Lachnospiraceae bacterium]
MLTFFPKPYPDELLYSIIARYHIWSGNDSYSDTMEQLFDYRLERFTILIPKHLPRLAEKTSEFGLDYETLLYQHTMFPLATCFFSKSSFDNILENTKNIDQNEKSYSLCNQNLIPKYLRYCPFCIRDDRDNFGEAYWHRKHQSYGVEMCDKHKCRLVISGIEAKERRGNRYIALETLGDQTDTFDLEDKSEYKVEMQIAYDIDYIYKNYKFIRNLMWKKNNLIKEATIALLFERDLATKKGFVRKSKLRQEFQSRYNSLELKQLMELLDQNPRLNWLTNLCNGQNTVVPIRFILFADFLAGSMEHFVSIINEQEPFIDRKKETYRTPIEYEKKLVLYRRRWLDAWNRNPNSCRHDLIKSDKAAYTWLYRYDNEWLLNNSPQLKKPNGRIATIDWTQIDQEFESMVDDAVYHIMNLAGKPVRVNRSSISHYLQKSDYIAANYKKLPNTIHKIEQYTESLDNYLLRKIEWVRSELEKEGKPATPYIILNKAGISYKDFKEFRHLIT